MDKCPKCGNTKLSYFYGNNQAYCLPCQLYFPLINLTIQHQR